MKKTFVIHPFLFAIFPILFLCAYNVKQFSFSETLLPSAMLPLVIVLGFTFLLMLLLETILKDSKKTGIIISIFLVLFFSYGHVFDIIRGGQIEAGSFVIRRHRYLLPSWAMLFICGAYFTIRTRRDLHDLTNILNITATFLVIISLVNIASYNVKTRAAWYDIKSTENIEISTAGSSKADTLPDIYYIILDGYANSSTLGEIYNYDNHDFTEYLKDNDFYIASESRSNYAATGLSLASSLNMEYINYLSDIVGIESKDLAMPFQMIEDSKVMNFLKSKGYKFIHFNSGWAATERNKYADLVVTCGRWNEFLRVLSLTTMLLPFEYRFRIISFSFSIGDNAKRERILCTFSKLAEVHRIKGPKFVFAHIPAPHPPYVFGANGEPVPSGNDRKGKENYLNQLIFVNKKVKVLVNEILSRSNISPIIILQADHGPDLTFGSDGWNRPTENMLRERMRIFNACYLPSGGNDLLYDSITPVNTFRIIFNFYFDTNYELLSDESYFSSYQQIYKFVNVTDKVKYD